ncbi:hypothetical protein BC829DRAFT_446103 [Chytridium lagenaria]|nr:hypothetical protein BC829DRAFT_446103 [Chytridium lagenaria]
MPSIHRMTLLPILALFLLQLVTLTTATPHSHSNDDTEPSPLLLAPVIRSVSDSFPITTTSRPSLLPTTTSRSTTTAFQLSPLSDLQTDLTRTLQSLSPCAIGCLQKVPTVLSMIVSGQLQGICDPFAVDVVRDCAASCRETTILPSVYAGPAK